MAKAAKRTSRERAAAIGETFGVDTRHPGWARAVEAIGHARPA
jgi:hypothetical protein